MAAAIASRASAMRSRFPEPASARIPCRYDCISSQVASLNEPCSSLGVSVFRALLIFHLAGQVLEQLLGGLWHFASAYVVIVARNLSDHPRSVWRRLDLQHGVPRRGCLMPCLPLH